MATSQATWGAKLESYALREQLGSFTAWWTGELQALMPAAWRERMGRGTHRLLVDVDGHQARISLHNADGARELGVLELGAALHAQPDIEAALREAARQPLDEILVRVPQRQALIRTLSFPPAAEENLREVLAFEMDRHTPFKAEHVYYDYAIAKREPGKGAIGVKIGRAHV